MNDARTISRTLQLLRATVPGQHPDINADTVAVWLQRLQWIPEGTLTEAAMTWGKMEFPSVGEFATWCDSVNARIVAEDRERYRTGDLATLACPECSDGGGWVPEPESRREGYEVPVRPCSKCNPRGFWLWRNAHYGPNHECRICRALHKGNGDLLAEAMARAERGPIETTATVASEF